MLVTILEFVILPAPTNVAEPKFILSATNGRMIYEEKFYEPSCITTIYRLLCHSLLRSYRLSSKQKASYCSQFLTVQQSGLRFAHSMRSKTVYLL